jgi:hypothetical protein
MVAVDWLVILPQDFEKRSRHMKDFAKLRFNRAFVFASREIRIATVLLLKRRGEKTPLGFLRRRR